MLVKFSFYYLHIILSSKFVQSRLHFYVCKRTNTKANDTLLADRPRWSGLFYFTTHNKNVHWEKKKSDKNIKCDGNKRHLSASLSYKIHNSLQMWMSWRLRRWFSQYRPTEQASEPEFRSIQRNFIFLWVKYWNNWAFLLGFNSLYYLLRLNLVVRSGNLVESAQFGH